MKLKFYGSDFSSCSESEVPGFVSLEGNKGVFALKQYLVALGANLRQGNACAKDRGDVSGTGKKPYRQKGTGMARQGSKRSPIWAGGGVVFGPKPRDYSQKVNRRVKRLALMRALWDKALEGTLCVIDKLTCDEPKTKKLNVLLEKAFQSGSILFVDDNFNANFVLASRNIGRVFMIDSNSLNAFDVVRHGNVIISDNAMKAVVDRLTDKTDNKE
ncbi:MAG: 50S ribosomal protein L4 [Puniceicoccales bacterium]|jgi:large subunit ribosomal protein L4|nr:50S ribosomal protein L4 [Puniceicoccales bacterium]